MHLFISYRITLLFWNFILFQRMRICTTSNAMKVVLTELVIALILYSYSIWTISVTHHSGQAYCTGLQPQFEGFYKVMVNVDTVVTLILPSCAILLFNIRIIVAILQMAKRRNELTENIDMALIDNQGTKCRTTITKPEGAKYKLAMAARQSERQKHHGTITSSELKTTRLLILISTVFIILNLPSHAIRIYDFVKKLENQNFSSSQTIIRVQELAQFFYYLNFCTNFFFYTMFTKMFRKSLVRLCRRIACKIQKCSHVRVICFLRRRPEKHDPPELPHTLQNMMS